MPSWIGDCVMAHALIRELAVRGGRLDALVSPLCAPVVSMMPEVRGVVVAAFVHGRLQFGYRRKLARELRARKYVRAYVLPNKAKSALIPLLARVPVRTGWRGEMRYFLLNDLRVPAGVRRHQAHRYAALASASGEAGDFLRPRLEMRATLVCAALAGSGLAGCGRLLALCPGASGGEFKRWPARLFAQVAGEHAARGGCVAVLGTEADSVAGEGITAAAVRSGAAAANLAGRTTLAGAAALLGAAGAAVANDSGLMHIAAALGTPTVGVFGPTDPQDSGPLGENAAVVRPPGGGLGRIGSVTAEMVVGALRTVMRG